LKKKIVHYLNFQTRLFTQHSKDNFGDSQDSLRSIQKIILGIHSSGAVCLMTGLDVPAPFDFAKVFELAAGSTACKPIEGGRRLWLEI
jgi:hypothetical protein